MKPTRPQPRLRRPRIRGDRPARPEDGDEPVQEKPLLSYVRTYRRAGELASQPRAHTRGAAVHPEIRSRSETPVPLERVARSPRMALAARQVLDVLQAA